MVELIENTDKVFHALADGTRRDILRRTLQQNHSISSLASSYNMSFAAVAKHINVLSRAQLIKKYKEGREQMIEANVATIAQVRELLETYETLWVNRLESLDALLRKL